MSLLLFPTRNILIKEEKRVILKKSRRARRLKILQVFLYNVGCPPMMNQSAREILFLPVSPYVAHMHFETKVGTFS